MTEREGREQEAESRGIGRREALGVMAMVPAVAAWDWGGASVVEKAARKAEEAIAESGGA
jgi:hypothetical protein